VRVTVGASSRWCDVKFRRRRPAYRALRLHRAGHGDALSSILASERAISVNIEIMRAFVRLLNPPQPPKRPVGFVTLTEKKSDS